MDEGDTYHRRALIVFTLLWLGVPECGNRESLWVYKCFKLIRSLLQPGQVEAVTPMEMRVQTLGLTLTNHTREP